MTRLPRYADLRNGGCMRPSKTERLHTSLVWVATGLLVVVVWMGVGLLIATLCG